MNYGNTFLFDIGTDFDGTFATKFNRVFSCSQPSNPEHRNKMNMYFLFFMLVTLKARPNHFSHCPGHEGVCAMSVELTMCRSLPDMCSSV